MVAAALWYLFGSARSCLLLVLLCEFVYFLCGLRVWWDALVLTAVVRFLVPFLAVAVGVFVLSFFTVDVLGCVFSFCLSRWMWLDMFCSVPGGWCGCWCLFVFFLGSVVWRRVV